ncbi:COesterase domain-containing protein [Mycena kentingensis (nom. inval.)]|nr:COesterase domain-containing protein [Mycena kentingensis (nom. inval.)]
MRYSPSLLAAVCFGTSAWATSPVVNLGYAQYQGAVNSTSHVTSFLGIRYAAPPIGDLRFRAPQPPLAMQEIQTATTQPAQCMQAPVGANPSNPLSNTPQGVLRRTDAEVPVQSEDCLFLNVYYPSDASGNPPKKLLPTLVWIHGGGYILQFPTFPDTHGESIIQQSNRGVVVVLVQYRLGLFGFLPGAEVKTDGALNAGLRDQEYALRWVNEHIAKFGGDPDKVTIWGESAGAGSVLQHLVANNGRTEPQLFRGAITSSTFLPSQYHYNDPIPEFLFSEVLNRTSCSNIACLRAAPVDSLQAINMDLNLKGFFGTFVFVPVVDGDFITQPIIAALKEGKVNGRALLSVTNTFEGSIFVNTSAATSAREYALDLFPEFRIAEANTVEKLYKGLGDDAFQDVALHGESIFICPTYYLLRAFQQHAFKAEFAVGTGQHGLDLGYFWPSETSHPDTNSTAFINAFAQTFTSFAINLDPNRKVSDTITPLWPKYTSGNRQEMLFNLTNEDTPDVRTIKTEDTLLRRCEFWEGVGNLTGQ